MSGHWNPGSGRNSTFYIDRLPVLSIGSPQPIYTCVFFGTLHDACFNAEIVRKTQHILRMITHCSGIFHFILCPILAARTLSPQLPVGCTSSFHLRVDQAWRTSHLGGRDIKWFCWNDRGRRMMSIRTLPTPGK